MVSRQILVVEDNEKSMKLFRDVLQASGYRTPLRNLYLCGSGAHPGGGITGGPGQNAAREILSDLRRRT